MWHGFVADWRAGAERCARFKWQALLLAAMLSAAPQAGAITDIKFKNPLKAVVNAPFSFRFFAVGGHAPKYPLSWQVGPEGCLIDSGFDVDPDTGVLSGSRSTPATYNCTITGFDSFGETRVTRPFMLIVRERKAPSVCLAPAITSSALPPGAVGVPYRFALDVFGDPTPTLAVTGLPDGLAFDPASSLIVGTPTTSGVVAVTITAANRCSAPVAQTLTLTIGRAITTLLLAVTPNPVIFGQTVSAAITASGGLITPQGTVQVCAHGSAGYCGPPFDVIPPGTPADRIRAPVSAALDASGHAQITLTGLLIDNYAVAAMYAGDSMHLAASTGPVTEFVIKGLMLAVPQVALLAPASVANSAALNVAVAVMPTKSTLTPTGSVQLFDESALVGSATLDASGKTKFLLHARTSGTLTLRAEYRGDTWFPPATSAQSKVMVTGVSPAADPVGASSVPVLSSAALALLSAMTALLAAWAMRRRARQR